MTARGRGMGNRSHPYTGAERASRPCTEKIGDRPWRGCERNCEKEVLTSLHMQS